MGAYVRFRRVLGRWRAFLGILGLGGPLSTPQRPANELIDVIVIRHAVPPFAALTAFATSLIAAVSISTSAPSTDAPTDAGWGWA